MAVGEHLLVIDRREARVDAAAGVLHVREAGGRSHAFPLSQLGLVVLNGSARISAHALRALAEAGVALVVTGGRMRQSAALLSPGLSASVRLRHAQHLAHDDGERRRRIVQHVLTAKFAAIAACARLRAADDPIARQADAACARLALARGIEQMRGIEGALAAAVFADFARRIPAHWQFRGRARRPPPCPTNALLSYYYAVVRSEVVQVLHQYGLDPAVGFLHDIVPGREALALDVLEYARPAVEHLVGALLVDGPLQAHDFSSEDGACLMLKPARALLLAVHARARRAWPGSGGLPLDAWLRRQVRALARAIDADAELPAEPNGDAAEPAELPADDATDP